ncbi:hypothetical protein [Alkalihalobacillus sp. 1P02AB]|uniref:hypothetical protein n=1 Tax=Alkalihalobacillus sp. 1P02AB TaxID=3132260 RepID=UPI0039A52CB9
MRTLYQEVEKRIKKVPLERLWDGFQCFPFALYNSNTVFFQDREITTDERFIANTCIEFEGQYIAIWNVEMDAIDDPDILAANIIHEMFHAFQREQGEKRYVNDLIMLSYPNDVLNYQYKHAENQFLIKALKASSVAEKKEMLQQMVSIRLKRAKQIGTMIQNEFLVETIEGAAEFVGTLSLKYINSNKYEERIHNYIEMIREPREDLFNIRKLSYFTGTLYLIALTETNILFEQNLKTESSIYETTLTYFSECDVEVDIEQSKSIQAEYEAYVIKKKNEWKSFFQLPVQKVEMNSRIVGYDPMNMVKVENQILCKHFVILKNEEEEVFFKGPLVIELKESTYNEVIAYYLPEEVNKSETK